MRSKQLSENLKKVRESINTYCATKVRLIAVSKKFPIEDINCLIDRWTFRIWRKLSSRSFRKDKENQ